MTEDNRVRKPIPRSAIFEGKDLLSEESLIRRIGPTAVRAMRMEYIKRRESAGVPNPRFYAHGFTQKSRDITKEEFRFRTGKLPIQDDLDRCNCPKAGERGHTMCGWDEEHHLPRFMTYGRGPDQKLLPANTELSSTLTGAAGQQISYGYLAVPVLLSELTRVFSETNAEITERLHDMPKPVIVLAVEHAYRKTLSERGWIKQDQDPFPSDLITDE